jgi:tRNA-specific adenosine deaminase 1
MVPARPDAPLSLSKSCTDKLAMYQCTSILNSTTSLLMSPQRAYIKTLVLPASQHVYTATERAFSLTGRMCKLTPDVTRFWENGLAFRPFNIATTILEFEWSRRSGDSEYTMLPSNVTTAYTPHFQETLIAGVLQGRKQFDPRGASALCRKSMWHAAKEVFTTLGILSISTATDASCYKDFKACQELGYRRRVKDVVCNTTLLGWARNKGDDSFSCP